MLSRKSIELLKADVEGLVLPGGIRRHAKILLESEDSIEREFGVAQENTDGIESCINEMYLKFERIEERLNNITHQNTISKKAIALNIFFNIIIHKI